jgi:hypothetical protein
VEENRGKERRAPDGKEREMTKNISQRKEMLKSIETKK